MLRSADKIAGMLLLAGLCPAALAQATSAVLKITGTGQASVTGSVTITVNGIAETVPFGPYSTASSVAAGFGAYFSAPPQTVAPPLCASGICAKSDGAAIAFQFEGGTSTPTESWSTTPNSPFQVDASLWPGSGPSAPLPMTLVCTPNPVNVGSTVACMAGLPAGTAGSVSFTVDGTSWQTGVGIDSAGNAVASGGLSGSSAGTHLVEAQYTSAAGIVSSAYESVEVETGSSSSSLVYFYSISTQPGAVASRVSGRPIVPGVTGYAANGNIVAYSDSVNGYWTLGYDALNRLTSSAQGLVNGGFNSYGCWSYDSFGNRTEQATSNQAIQPYGCQPTSGASSFYATTMQFADGTNRITARGTVTPSGTQTVAAPGYDSAGNLTADQSYGYVYDGQGHMCAAHTAQGMVGYVYDAEGNRVAKGTITAMSCDPTANGFVLTTLYELGPNGQPMTEVDNGAWSHTDVYAGGLQVATYDGNGVHFQLHDWLGTRRVQTNYAGVVEDTCSSNPYGDNQTCSNPVMDSSDTHFTGKPRDAESGLDFFGARMYASSMGRWMSPDWSSTPTAVPYATLANPQTLNLYRYVANNPLVGRDLDGHRYIANVPNSLMISMYDNLLRVETNPAQLMAEQMEDEQKQQTADQPQDSSSLKPGFWDRLRHHFANLAHLHRWNYEEDSEPSEATMAVTDTIGIITVTIHLGPVSKVNSVVSTFNDWSPLNIWTNVLGFVPGYDGPMAITGAFNDYLDYGIKHSHGSVNLRDGPILGDPNENPDYEGEPLGPPGGGGNGQPSCEIDGNCPPN